MDEELRDSYRTLVKRLFHEGRIITPSFIAINNMLPFFQDIGFEPFLTLNEPICPRFVVEFYHSLEVKRNELDIPYIEFKLGQFTFTLTPSRLSQILKTPHALETFYTSEWSLNSLDDHPNSNYFGPKHDIIKKAITTSRTTQTQLEFIKKCKGPMPFAMLLTRLYNYILATNPQAVVPIARFTFHEHVMDPLDISRNPSTEKGKKFASSSVISSSSSSSNDNEAPFFLEFYDELSDSDDLTKAQREKRGMFKCFNRYVGTITKYLEKQNDYDCLIIVCSCALSKSISSKSTYNTSSSSPSESPTPTHVAPPPKLCFVIPIKLKPQKLPPLQVSPNDPYVQTMDNWPPGPSNPSPPPRVSRPHLTFPNPPPKFKPLPSTQPLFVNINTNTSPPQ
nr:hypothetical protein [Tanacetum cinerariifolium]